MEFIPEGATVNKEHLRRLRSSFRCKRPELWCRKNWLLLHHRAAAHSSVLVHEKVAIQQVTALTHPSYSPDLATCDFFFFSHLKAKLRWPLILGWDRHCHEGHCTGPPGKYFSSVCSSFVQWPTTTILRVDVDMYLVIWCDKNQSIKLPFNIYILALQPFVRPWSLFQFFNILHSP
jgi:hypothetical protein